MKKIMLVVGARPNFMKIAPILRALNFYEDMSSILVHTGQHYDENMSSSFFSSLNIKTPEYNLGVGSGSHAKQTAEIMILFEKVCIVEKPDIVLVVGDVNSTIAAGLVAKKLHIQLAHVEAGLRSGDRSMPEEINRIATDSITDLFFTTEEEGTANLLKEGHHPGSIHFVGHVMIDNLFHQLSVMGNKSPNSISKILKKCVSDRYVCMTLHRPSNICSKESLLRIFSAVGDIAKTIPVIFPCHPHTYKQLKFFNLLDLFVDSEKDAVIKSGILLLDPMDYNEFLYLWKNALLVLTDSGGLQEETTALKVPCLTLRNSTERPVTERIGSNVVVGTDSQAIIEYGNKALCGKWKKSEIPPLWDGKASERIVNILRNI